MKKFLIAFGLLALLPMASSCDDGVDTDSQAVATDPSQITLCRNIAGSLRGRPASVYRVSYSEDILAVDIDGQIACVDTISETLQTGLIAVPPVIQPNWGPNFDGTPLPAEQFNFAVRMHLLYLPNVLVF